MAFPTVAQCNTAAQSRAADVDGDILTAAVLLPGIQGAVRDLFRAFSIFDNPRIIKSVYYPLPANTTVLHPATAGISDMGEPIALYERGNITTVNVDSATANASSLSVSTATAHGRTTGDMVTLNQLGGITGADGMFAATVVDADDLTINGLVCGGTYTSGGTVTYSAERFSPVASLASSRQLPNDTDSRVRASAWEGDRWLLGQANAAVEIAIDYYSSATVPTGDTDVIAVDDCVDYIAYRALAIVNMVRAPQIAQVANAEASRILQDMVRQGVKSLQTIDQQQRQRPPFRSRNEYTSYLAEYYL